MDEVQSLINWLSAQIRDAQRREAEISKSLSTKPGSIDELDKVRAKIKRLQELRSGVASREYSAIDEARTMKVDAEDAVG